MDGDRKLVQTLVERLSSRVVVLTFQPPLPPIALVSEGVFFPLLPGYSAVRGSVKNWADSQFVPCAMDDSHSFQIEQAMI